LEREKNPKGYQLFYGFCHRNPSRADCAAGSFQAGGYSGCLSGLWISEKVCRKVYIPSVCSGDHRSFSSGMYSSGGKSSEPVSMGVLWGWSSLCRNCRLFLYWKDAEDPAE